jgi:adenosylhomocysteinase
MTVDLESGRRKLAWARAHMPIHAHLREQWAASQPFAGQTVAVCSHLEAKTGVFIETLAALGAQVVFTASEPRSTQDDVVAALLAQPGIRGYARREANEVELAQLHAATLAHAPSLILDDAAELTAAMIQTRPDLLPRLLGTCEQTTTGVQRLKAMAAQGLLGFPAYAVNDTPMKRYFDNIHGTGESALANLALAANLLLAGKRLVVAGYGYCGRGVAQKARGWQARVLVTETDPRQALQAHMAGFEVAPMILAAAWGNVFITATGSKGVLRREHFEVMRDGALLANVGHFDVEIDTQALAELAQTQREVRAGITEYQLRDGRRLYLIAQGHLLNLTAPAAMGHPIEVMDQTFAMQIVAAQHLLAHRAELSTGVHTVPDIVDKQVAQLKLTTLGIDIDIATQEQASFSNAWSRQAIKS